MTFENRTNVNTLIYHRKKTDLYQEHVECVINGVIVLTLQGVNTGPIKVKLHAKVNSLAADFACDLT